MSSSVTIEYLEGFVEEVLDKFGREYLRNDKEADLCRILSINVARGFFDIGSWDLR